MIITKADIVAAVAQNFRSRQGPHLPVLRCAFDAFLAYPDGPEKLEGFDGPADMTSVFCEVCTALHNDREAMPDETIAVVRELATRHGSIQRPSSQYNHGVEAVWPLMGGVMSGRFGAPAADA